MESRATLRYNRQSPFKVRKVLNAVRGSNVGTAINYLHFSSEKASLAIEKTIRSAVANLMQNDETNDIDPDSIQEPEATYGEDFGNSPESTGGADDWDDENRVRKFHVNGVPVKALAERVQYYDSDGKLVTESFKDYTRKTMVKQFSSLDEFTKRWNESDRKQAIIDELAEAGILWEALEDEVGKDMDPFDMICHVVYDQPALTRKERADNVKKRNYFTKYGDTAQQVLNNLLDKYADEGVQEIENIHVLKVKPFDEMGRPLEIIKKGFGGKPQYLEAVNELEAAIYQSA